MANQYTEGWNDEQIEYLEMNMGVLTFDRIAKKVGKTVTAVESKVDKLGIGDTKIASGLLTMHELAKCLCVDDKTVKRMIENDGLPAKRKNFRIKPKPSKDGEIKPKRLRYYIDVEEFWKWAEQNKDRINWHQVPRYALTIEPRWVEPRRKEDFYKWLNRRKNYTPEQDRQLWTMYYKEGLTQKKIAMNLGKTPASVERRLMRLRKKNYGASF